MSERQVKVLQVFVIEEHSEAIECMSLAIRRKIMNLNTCDLVHFDSHPDLSCPDNIQYQHLFDLKELSHIIRNSECGISTFILPSIALGLLKNVVWVKPSWSNQIPNGFYPKMTFGWKTTHDLTSVISDNGENLSENKMVMITSLPYWVDDGVSIDEDHKNELADCVSFDLNVININDWNYDTNEWILDVCLDYFSCANPLNEPFLPDHVSTSEELVELLGSFRDALLSRSNQPPKFCMIARSEVDGFTPDTVAGKLETAVLAIIEEVFGITKVHIVKSHDDFYDTTFISKIK